MMTTVSIDSIEFVTTKQQKNNETNLIRFLNINLIKIKKLAIRNKKSKKSILKYL